MDGDMRLGRAIANARTNARMSQQQLAVRIGVAEKTVSKIENGRPFSGMKQLFDIAGVPTCRSVFCSRMPASSRTATAAP